MNAQVRCAHILQKHIKSRNPTDSHRNKKITRTPEEALANIIKFRDEIVNEKNDFANVAQEFSECRSAANSGDLGYFGKNEMQKEFEEVAFNLQKGELSQPVSTDSGIHIILRID